MPSPSYQEASADGSGCRAAPRPAVELRNVGKTFGAVQAAYVRNLRVLGGGLLAVLRQTALSPPSFRPRSPCSRSAGRSVW